MLKSSKDYMWGLAVVAACRNWGLMAISYKLVLAGLMSVQIIPEAFGIEELSAESRPREFHSRRELGNKRELKDYEEAPMPADYPTDYPADYPAYYQNNGTAGYSGKELGT